MIEHKKYLMAQPKKQISSICYHGNNKTNILHTKSEEISQKDVEIRSKIFAQMLKDSGCKKEDVICCVMGKSTDFLISLKGIQYAGCISVPINPYQTVDHIQSVIFESGARWIIADRRAEPVLSSDFHQQKIMNVGWMDAIDKIPAGCLPEFVRDNIDHSSLHPVLFESDDTESAITFFGNQNTNQIKNYSFSKKKIEKFAIPILEFLGVDSNSKVVGLMNCDSPSVLLEIMSLFYMGSRLFLFNSDRLPNIERLKSEIQQQQITHLFLETATIGELVKKSFLRNPGCPSVITTVIWGKRPTENTLARFKKTFPNTTIFKVTEGPEQQLSVHVNTVFSYKFKPVASIPFTPQNYFKSKKR